MKTARARIGPRIAVACLPVNLRMLFNRFGAAACFVLTIDHRF